SGIRRGTVIDARSRARSPRSRAQAERPQSEHPGAPAQDAPPARSAPMRRACRRAARPARFRGQFPDATRPLSGKNRLPRITAARRPRLVWTLRGGTPRLVPDRSRSPCPVNFLDILTLFGAGFLGGVVSTIAGGGTFITFPALVFAGLPEVVANATATVAILPGYLSATLGFRREVMAFDRALLWRLTLWSALGGGIGSGLLLISPNSTFRAILPALLLAA